MLKGMTKVFFFLFILIHQSVFGQMLCKQSLINDLTYLNEAIVNGHPVNYNPQNEVNILSVIDRAKEISSTDSISALDYKIWIEKGIYNVGCIHTSIYENPLKNDNDLSFIPLTASIQNEGLKITSCDNKSKIGQIIKEINGHNATEIISFYKEYKASDGIGNAFSKEYFHFASSRLISDFLSHPKQYEIRTSKGEYILNGQNKVFLNTADHNSNTSLLSNKENKLYLKDDFVILKVSDFDKSDRAFFKNAFEKINELKTEKLIVDLRQNTGGNRNAAIELTKYLADTTFSYSILQPKLATKKYLNGKGKLFLFLSKLKYNVGNIFRKHNSTLGKEFIYTYKPKSRNHFYGKLYVLTDGFTASSSTMVTSWLKQYSNAIFIGSQSGGGYNGNNGGSFPLITLPDSKIQIKFPAYRLILDNKSDMNSGLIPDILLDTNAEIYTIINKIQEL